MMTELSSYKISDEKQVCEALVYNDFIIKKYHNKTNYKAQTFPPEKKFHGVHRHKYQFTAKSTS